eukprot:268119-Pyramimonas_sp.AAC.1
MGHMRSPCVPSAPDVAEIFQITSQRKIFLAGGAEGHSSALNVDQENSDLNLALAVRSIINSMNDETL